MSAAIMMATRLATHLRDRTLEPPTHHFAVHPIGYWVCSLVQNMTQNFSIRAFDRPFEKGYLAFRSLIRLDNEQDAIR
jgi:hypothetical protein